MSVEGLLYKISSKLTILNLKLNIYNARPGFVTNFSPNLKNMVTVRGVRTLLIQENDSQREVNHLILIFCLLEILLAVLLKEEHHLLCILKNPFKNLSIISIIKVITFNEFCYYKRDVQNNSCSLLQLIIF